ncbi:hypothetical protein L484_025952 [Morus notabilis]|uniref:Uncharacterized protein n=1 Tax=Morus notabilis TaxID=981085 RepID=W9RW77_9ROSA|nr:hypothetical protein L484_025952 [Morus notabilis]
MADDLRGRDHIFSTISEIRYAKEERLRASHFVLDRGGSICVRYLLIAWLCEQRSSPSPMCDWLRDLLWLRGTRSPARFDISSGLEREREREINELFPIYNPDFVRKREIGDEREGKNVESGTHVAMAFTLSHVRNLP